MSITLSFVICILLGFIPLNNAVGRNPTVVEHNACRVTYAEYLIEVKDVYKDVGARVTAINRGLEGHPCMTACRLIFRGNTKDLDDIFTPNNVMCATGLFPRYCLNGKCVLPDDKPKSVTS